MKTEGPSPRVIALIPARAGSKRLTGKNIRPIAGHPLLAYSIAAALDSKVFSAVMVSTDSEDYANIARHYGAEVPFLRPSKFGDDFSPDIEWLEHAIKTLESSGRRFDCFSILRPTSPFRQAETIQRAWLEFLSEKDVDSLRAVEKCKQHPHKMWIVKDHRMEPFIAPTDPSKPGHSAPYQALPEIYTQNASLEIAWTRVVFEDRSIAGRKLMPFYTQGYEGFDVNQELDWLIAEKLLQLGKAKLPAISKPAYTS